MILAVTGSTSSEDKKLLTDNGADAVLIKPLNLANFRKAMALVRKEQRDKEKSGAKHHPQVTGQQTQGGGTHIGVHQTLMSVTEV